MAAINNKPHMAYNLFTFMAIVLMLYVLKPVIVPLIFSIILSIMLYPLVIILERKLHYNRLMSTIIVILLLIIVSCAVVAFIGYQIKDVLSKTDVYVARLTELYQEILNFCGRNLGIDKKEIMSQKSLRMETIIKNSTMRFEDFVTFSGTLISNLLLIPIYIFFMLLYRKFFIAFVHKAFPRKDNEYLNIILKKIYITQQNYLIGLTIVMIIVGVLNSIGLLLLGIENAIFYGFLGAFLLLIPYIGIIVGSLLPAFVALATKDSVWYSVGVIGVFSFVQILEGNWITPKITGSKVNLNAFISILSLVLFSLLWGLVGMVLALPVTATLKIIFDQIPSLKPYGFVMGEPEDEYLKSKGFARLQIWKELRKNKKY